MGDKAIQEEPVLKPIFAGLVVATLAAPAWAEEYWVQYDYSTHECSVVQSDTHQTATRFPWSPPNDGSKPQGGVSGAANGNVGEATGGATNGTADPNGSNANADATNGNATPNGSNANADATNGNATPNGSNAASGAPNETGASNTSNTTNGTGTAGSTNGEQSESPVVAAWRRNAELAQKNKIDVTTALIGSAKQTREEAEQEMQIMRRCGLKP